MRALQISLEGQLLVPFLSTLSHNTRPGGQFAIKGHLLETDKNETLFSM